MSAVRMAEMGRPPFKATLAVKRKVEELVCGGMSRDAVARAIGIDVDTLKKHCLEELETGTAKKRAEVIGLLFKSARAGNVSAQKKLEEMSRVSDAAEGIESRSATPARLGKKEEQQLAAERVGGKFSPPSAPKLN